MIVFTEQSNVGHSGWSGTLGVPNQANLSNLIKPSCFLGFKLFCVTFPWMAQSKSCGFSLGGPE